VSEASREAGGADAGAAGAHRKGLPSSVRSTGALLLLVALSAASLGGLSGCGVRSAPRPPEDTAPIITGELEVRRDDGAVVLRWNRAERSADGRRLDDLAAFVVERRRDGEDAWEKLGAVDVLDQEKIRRRRNFSWRDDTPGSSAAFYRVRAVCTDGQEGPAVEGGVAMRTKAGE